MAITNYYSVNGQMIGYKSGGARKDFLTDNLGSITAEYDQTGVNQTYKARYKPYGGIQSSTGTSGKFGWVGSWGYRRMDIRGSSHYIRARHLSEISGNWTTVDFAWPDELPYNYSFSNPLLYIDPFGLAPCIEPESCKPNAFANRLKDQDDCSVKRGSGADKGMYIIRVVKCMDVGCSAAGKKKSECSFIQAIKWTVVEGGRTYHNVGYPQYEPDFTLDVSCPGKNHAIDGVGYSKKKPSRTGKCTDQKATKISASTFLSLLPIKFDASVIDYCACGDSTSQVSWSVSIVIKKGKNGVECQLK